MSVQYALNKIVTIGDLKKIGLEIEDHREETHCYPFVVNNADGSGVAINQVNTKDDDNVDNWEITEFEGKCSCGGAGVMLEICDKLDCKFITDEDIDDLIYTNQDEVTDEMFENRTNKFRKLMKNEQP